MCEELLKSPPPPPPQANSLNLEISSLFVNKYHRIGQITKTLIQHSNKTQAFYVVVVRLFLLQTAELLLLLRSRQIALGRYKPHTFNLLFPHPWFLYITSIGWGYTAGYVNSVILCRKHKTIFPSKQKKSIRMFKRDSLKVTMQSLKV